MSVPKVPANAPHRLIVEGPDDKHTIIQLTARHGWNWEAPRDHFPYVDSAGGDNQALEALPVALLSYQRVGIVLDADLTPSSRWQAIGDRLAGRGFQLPPEPDPRGTVIENGDGKRLGVWLMPDNQNPGKLEDFLAVLVPVADPCWGWSGESTERAKSLGAGFSPPDFIKARVYTWLAWQREPGLPFGTAIRSAAFAHDTEAALRFVTWMERVFG